MARICSAAASVAPAYAVEERHAAPAHRDDQGRAGSQAPELWGEEESDKDLDRIHAGLRALCDRGYLRKHLAPVFGGRPLDKIDRAYVESFMLAKRQEGLSTKTVGNLLNFLHGIFGFSIKREWAIARAWLRRELGTA